MKLVKNENELNKYKTIYVEGGGKTVSLFMKKNIPDVLKKILKRKQEEIVDRRRDVPLSKLASDILFSLIGELDVHLKRFNTDQAAKKRVFIEERIKDVKLAIKLAKEALTKDPNYVSYEYRKE